LNDGQARAQKAFAAFSVYPIMGAGCAIGEIESEERVVDIEAIPAPEAGTSK
jgi:hypothetical protein